LLFFAAPDPSGCYSVIKKIPIEGKGGWDYLVMDEVARRLYVSHGTAVDERERLRVFGKHRRNTPETMFPDPSAVNIRFPRNRLPPRLCVFQLPDCR